MKIEQVKKEDAQAVLAGIVAFEFGLFEAAIKQAERRGSDNGATHSKKND
jgi:hypothetical protein